MKSVKKHIVRGVGSTLGLLLLGLVALPAHAQYATGGSGAYRSQVLWFDWGVNGASIPQTGATVTNTYSVAGQSFVVTCTLNGISGTGTDPDLQIYQPGTYFEDGLDDLYNVGGAGTPNTMDIGIVNRSDANSATFTYSCSATLGGSPYTLDGLVFADAETTNQDEYIRTTLPGGATMRVIDRYRGAGCTTGYNVNLTGSTYEFRSLSPHECFVSGRPEPAQANAMGVYFIDNASSATITFGSQLGKQAVALGVMVNVADYGDAPSTYGSAGHLPQTTWTGGTLAAGNTNIFGAGFTLATQAQPTTALLGARADVESPAWAGTGATLDDTNGGTNDEDGVTSLATLTTLSASYSVTTSCVGNAPISGWIDFNRNGTFDAGERNTNTSLVCSGGTATLNWTTLPARTVGQTYLRIRTAVSAAEIGSATGLATTGEAEDYALNIQDGSQPSFGTCTARMFYDVVNTAGTISTLYDVGYASPPFTFTSLGTGSARNGIVYNPQDNYLYGIEWTGFSGNELIRVGSDGSSVNLGVIAGLPVSNYNNGGISPAGDYYVINGASGGGNILYDINIATRTATPISLSRTVWVLDLAWYNGLLYGVDNSTGSNILVSINVTSGTVTNVGPTGAAGNPLALWGFSNGLYSTTGTSGTIYAIDPAAVAAGTGGITQMSTAPTTQGGDGANCPSAPVVFTADLSVTKTNTPASGVSDLANDTYTPGAVRTYTVVVSNSSGSFGAQNITVSDPVPTGIDGATMSWTCASTSGGAVCGAASGTGALNDTGLDLPPGAVATYTVTMTVPATFTGTLTNTVTVTPPSTINDTNTANNTASDIDTSSVGSITIVKSAAPSGPQDFAFTTTGTGLTGFSLDDDADAALSNTQVFTGLAAGNYTVTETVLAGWNLTNLVCNDPTSNTTVNLGARTATINLAAGENITCTYINTQASLPNFGTCDARMYLTQGVSTALYGINTGANPFTYTQIGAAGATYNATSYNPIDNYLYAMNYSTMSNQLIRVGSDGSTQNLGPVTNLPSLYYNSGAMSPSGVYYVRGMSSGTNAPSNMLYAINIATMTATPITLSAAITVSDIAFVGSTLYTVSDTGQLYSINVATGAVSPIGAPAIGGVMGAQFGGTNGLFGVENGGAGFFQIDLTTGARTLISNAPGSSVNDGANCPTAPITFNAEVGVTKTNTPASGPSDLASDTYAQGEVRTYTVVVTNGGPFGAQNVTVSDPVPTGIDGATMSWTCASTSGGAVCGAASGTGALNDTGLDLPSGAVATYLVTMTVPAGFTGTLTNKVDITVSSSNSDTNTSNNTATDADTPAAPPPMATCPVDAFITRGASDTAIRLYTLGLANGAMTDQGTSPALANQVNAIGFRQQDGYIWGWTNDSTSPRRLVRIGAGGQADLPYATAPAGLPGSAAFYAADVSPAGFYTAYDGNNSRLWFIDVTTNTVTGSVAVTGSDFGTDFAYHPADGNLYTVASGVVMRINPATGAAASTGITLPTGGSGGFGGVFFDNQGTLYAYKSNSPGGTGLVYRVFNVDGSGTGTFDLLSTSLTATSLDGARCPVAPPQGAPAIILRKKTDGDVGGPFGFTLNNTVQGSGTVTTTAIDAPVQVDGDNGTAGLQPFTIQNAALGQPLTLAESSLPTGWSLTDATCTRNGVATGARSGNTYTIPGAAIVTGALFECEFTNAKLGSITIVKDADPNHAQDFGFTTSGNGLANFVLDDDGDPTLANSQVFNNLVPGSYEVTETATVGWDLTNLVCTDPDSGSTANLGSRTATIDLDAGENITCTYTNTLRQTDIQVVKTASPGSVVSGGVVAYQIVVSNNGPLAVTDVLLTDTASPGQDCSTPSTTVTCSATGGASCLSPTAPVSTLMGSGVTIPALPVGGQVTFNLQCTVTASGL